jgi:hypothetical protein
MLVAVLVPTILIPVTMAGVEAVLNPRAASRGLVQEAAAMRAAVHALAAALTSLRWSGDGEHGADRGGTQEKSLHDNLISSRRRGSCAGMV